ncbi:hypothetical protein BH11PSE11_BH11PSE11_30730 [soil metagenome]
MQRKLGQQTGVSTTLSGIDVALVNFVARNRRLPCPADGALPSTAALAGVETATCGPLPNQTSGVIPWVTLGISESEATDPWNGRITYRVDPALTDSVTRLMNMTDCDGAGTAATVGNACRTPTTAACAPGGAGCTSLNNFLSGKGLAVQDGGVVPVYLNNPAAVPGTGAAYVIISHGPTGGGAFNKSGNYQPGPQIPNPLPPPLSLVAGTNEIPNLNNQALTGASIFMDAQQNSSLTPAHFDDYLSHPTITSVLTRASLQARSH